eukprot:5221400-Pyramimonas_sp.AAC.1
MLSYYNPAAERLACLPISMLRLITTPGTNIIRMIYHASSSVGRYRHGLRWPAARALAKYMRINVLQAYATPIGVLIRKPTEIMANHRLLLTPFERKRCDGHHPHASVCNKELSMAAQ